MDKRLRASQLLQLDPSENLEFKDGNGEGLCATLHLTNPSPYSILYKIKTTASKRYCVKPKSGLLPPYSGAAVEFKLRGELPSDEEMDKFKLLASILPDNMSGTEPSRIWLYVDEGNSMQSKLKALFPVESLPANSLKTNSARSYIKWVILSLLVTAVGIFFASDIKINY